MEVIDPGHAYTVTVYDQVWATEPATLGVRFMKREGEAYPGNIGAHSGTNCQELLRVLIDRVKYLNNQQACAENGHIVSHLRRALMLFEERAAKRHGRDTGIFMGLMRQPIEAWPACAICGHVDCVHQPVKINRDLPSPAGKDMSDPLGR